MRQCSPCTLAMVAGYLSQLLSDAKAGFWNGVISFFGQVHGRYPSTKA